MEHAVFSYNKQYNMNVSTLVHTTNLANTGMILGLFVLAKLPPNVRLWNVGIAFLFVCSALCCVHIPRVNSVLGIKDSVTMGRTVKRKDEMNYNSSLNGRLTNGYY